MDIRDYKKGDEHHIIELFEITFKQKMTLEQWKWRFSSNPAGNFEIKLMWEEDKLVGHYAVSPIICSVNNNDVKTSHSLTTMTHPEYGGKGIFKNLSSALYNDLENNKGFKAIWGFPNSNSHYGFVNSLGWSDISIIHTLSIKAEQISNSKYDIEGLNLFNEFNTVHENFINSKLINYPVNIKRTSDYLNWRYNKKPSVEYHNFYFDNSVGNSLIVTKVYPSQKANTWNLNIVELFMDDFAILPNLINMIMASYNLNFDNITIWRNLFNPDHLILERIGFKPTSPVTYFGARVHTDLDKEFREMRNWFISMGDSDVF